MKKAIKIFSLLLLTVFCVSCFKEDQMGCPKKLIFPKEGGVKTITFDHRPSLYIYDGPECVAFAHEYEKETEGGIQKYYEVQYEWLTARNNYNEKAGPTDITITVAPSNSKKSRKLELDVYWTNRYATVNIIQK